MKTLKVMSIISLVIVVLSFICMLTWEYTDPMAALGWGMINAMYDLAFTITVLVIACTHKSGDNSDEIEKLQ
jgi:hypothetical protein